MPQAKAVVEPYPHWQKWWNAKGWKMSPKLSLANKILVIENRNIARLTIKKVPLAVRKDSGILPQEEWLVQWYILHEYRAARLDLDDNIRGQVVMSERGLRTAFRVEGLEPESQDGFANFYGADVAIQGWFIRQESYLNIPHPGTPLQGDPNISIYVSDEIRDAVVRLLMVS